MNHFCLVNTRRIIILCMQAKLDGRVKIAAPLINKFINVYPDVRNVVPTIWKRALVFVIATGLDQIALKVGVSISFSTFLETFPLLPL